MQIPEKQISHSHSFFTKRISPTWWNLQCNCNKYLSPLSNSSALCIAVHELVQLFWIWYYENLAMLSFLFKKGQTCESDKVVCWKRIIVQNVLDPFWTENVELSFCFTWKCNRKLLITSSKVECFWKHNPFQRSNVVPTIYSQIPWKWWRHSSICTNILCSQSDSHAEVGR